MYLLILSYKKGLDAVEKYLDLHKVYLDKYYQLGNFIASGRRNPRVGGVIICKANSIDEVQAIIREDPFHKFEIADCEIIEFEPSKYVEGFDKFM